MAESRPSLGTSILLGSDQVPESYCLLHRGDIIQKYCHSHSTIICKVCITENHKTCRTEEISKLARNIEDSQDFRNFNQKLSTLKEGFNKNQTKSGANKLTIQRNHRDAVDDMKRLQDEFNKLMIETEKQTDNIKERDFTKIEKVSATCDIVVEQINKLTTQLEVFQENKANESLFIAMIRADSQLQSMENKLSILDKDNTVTEYKFKPDEKLKDLLNDLTVLGHTFKHASKSDQKAKKPVHIKDIGVKSTLSVFDNHYNTRGCLILSNKHILITDSGNKKLKLIDTNQNKIISEVILSGCPDDVTKVKADEVAVTVNSNPNTIQFISVTQNSMSKVREVTVDEQCRGITYNDRDKTLIVCFIDPPKVKILSMAGTEINCIEYDSKGGKLFQLPYHVALSPDMTNIYVSDLGDNLVTLLSLNGEVKAVYKDKTNKLLNPFDICIHKSGLVYVVGCDSHTVHELDPESGEFKVVLEWKDGLNSRPLSISYCEEEDKMYIGMYRSSVMKVFQMN